MKIRFFRTLTIVAIAGMLLAGCGPQSATPGPLPTQTVAAPANARRWQSNPVVASLYYSPGFTREEHAWSAMPALVVYADGRVIVAGDDVAGAQGGYGLGVAQVEPAEVCSLLNRIDGYGFFDYNAAEYTAPNVTDNGDTVIKVNAWRSMATQAYALGWALNPPNIPGLEFPEINVPSALSETHRLLADYRPATLAPYQPERIVLLIQRAEGSTDGEAWPLTAPSLQDLVAQAREEEVVLDGQPAADVYALLGAGGTGTYRDGDDTSSITARPLLPLEIWETQNGWGHESTFEDGPKVEMACAP